MLEQYKKLYFLKGLLIIQTIGLLVYTFVAINNDGANFFEKALEFSLSLTWIGQFSLDFACYLVLSALWITWRNAFSASSIILALIACILGIIVFAPYLLNLLYREDGNLKKVLIGDR